MVAEMNIIHISNNAECCLIHSIFNFPEQQQYIFKNTIPEYFTDLTFRKIYNIAKEIFQANNIVSNVDVFEKDNSLGSALKEIITEGDSFKVYVPTYCRQLYERYINKLILEAKTVDDVKRINDFIADYAPVGNKIKHISEGYDSFEERYKGEKETSLTTGYTSIDEVIGSFSGGDYIVLGGSTGVGKTSIAINIVNNLIKNGKQVLYFSLEMPLEQLQTRLVCMQKQINCAKLRNYTLNENEIEQYKKGLEQLKFQKLDVVSDYNLTSEKLRIYTRNKKKTGLDFVVVDYLGLLKGYNNKSLYESTTNLSRDMKLLASEMNIPILVLVQLNRDLKTRDDKRPKLSDIRESGAIEQDADFVLFAYRDFVFTGKGKPEELEITVAKNRHGECGKRINLNFDVNTQLITDKKNKNIQMKFIEEERKDWVWD